MIPALLIPGVYQEYNHNKRNSNPNTQGYWDHEAETSSYKAESNGNTGHRIYNIGHKEFRILHTGFYYPVGFDLPVEKKISAVSKMAKFNVQKFKGTENNDKGFKHYYNKAIKRIKSDGTIRFVRDTILGKRIVPIE